MASYRHLRFLMLAGLIACQGDPGPQGPPGLSGPGTRIVFAGVHEGPEVFAEFPLPAEAGTLDDPPALTCYAGPNPTDGYYYETNCRLKNAIDGSHLILGVNPLEGPNYRVVVVY